MTRPAPNVTKNTVLDIEQIREWLNECIAAKDFTALITCVLNIFAVLRDLNYDLQRKLVNSRANPPSERMKTLSGQAVLPGFGTDDGAKTKGGSNVDNKSAPQDPPAKPPRGNPDSKRPKHKGRNEFPAHLPQIDRNNAMPESQRLCPKCGALMTPTGHRSCRYLEIIPAQVVVVNQKDEVWSCDNVCEEGGDHRAPSPLLIPKGVLGTTLVVDALIGKFCHHMPLYRQTQAFAQLGVTINPATLAGHVNNAIDRLAPIAHCIVELVRTDEFLRSDTTSLRVLDRDHIDGVYLGVLWYWISPKHGVAVEFATHGRNETAREFLSIPDSKVRSNRIVQCDGTLGLTFVERSGGTRPGCWGHGRRGLMKCAKAGDLVAVDGLRLIGKLFELEAKRDRNETAEQCVARRRQDFTAPLAEIRAWLDENIGNALPKSALGKALGYLGRQWHRLILFLNDARIDLTNNEVERSIRYAVLGRKNWLFVEKEVGGRRLAVMETITRTCAAQNVNPLKYLRHVMKELIGGNTKYSELTPSALAARIPSLLLKQPDATAG